jgi:hypothetical protein
MTSYEVKDTIGMIVGFAILIGLLSIFMPWYWAVGVCIIASALMIGIILLPGSATSSKDEITVIRNGVSRTYREK